MAMVRGEKHYYGPLLFYANESCLLNLKAERYPFYLFMQIS
jgi:hypothetical protein